jgi:hypothetical protein
MRYTSDSQRKAIFAKFYNYDRNKIPAQTGSLSKAQPKDKAIAYRVWVKPKKGGDTFYETPILSKAKEIRKGAILSGNYMNVEPVIGVFKMNNKKYPKQKFWEARLK